MFRRLPRRAGQLFLAVSVPLLLPACGTEQHAATAAEEEATETPLFGPVEREIRDLITAVSPAAPDATAIARNDWFKRRKATLERLRLGSPELGRAALETYKEKPDASRDVRSALLDVAAHCLPDETRPILIDLVANFGDDLGLRKSAARYLAQTSPGPAAELLEPIVSTTEHGATYPPNDDLLESWVIAMDKLDRDPTEMLALVCTDIRQENAARHYAARQLGKRPGEVGRQALEAVLVESLGNNMLRRIAAQSLRDSLPKDEFCPIVQRTFDNEADQNMQLFLASMLEEVCL